MTYFTDDAVLEMPRGPDPWGRRFVGAAAVREGLQGRLVSTLDEHYGDDRHFVDADMGISQWTLTGTLMSSERIKVRGCDFYTLRDGKIAKKDSFWKIVETSL